MSTKKETPTDTWEALPENIRGALIANNLVTLKPEERVILYTTICAAKGLDPALRPFEFISFQGKLGMYARKECADQLRERHQISTRIESQGIQGPAYVVVVRASNPDGRTEDDIGATSILEPEYMNKIEQGKPVKTPNPRFGKPMDGPDIANAMMKAVTKAKRRATLAICGLGMMDQTDAEALQDAEKSRAPTIDEVVKIAAEVKALRERAAKAPKSEAQDLIRQACALESSILDLPGSGHVPENMIPNTEAELTERTRAAAARVSGGSPAAPATTASNVVPFTEQKLVEPSKPAEPAPPIVVTGQTGVTTQEIPLVKPEPAPPVTNAAPVATQAAAPAGDWRNHVVLMIPHRDFKGKKVGEIDHTKIKTIYENWVKKFPDEIAQNPDKTKDADAIKAAVAELNLGV